VETHERFATIQFYRLGEAASREYSGEFQGQVTFPEQDIVRLGRKPGPTIADVVTSVELLKETVGRLTSCVEKMAERIKGIAEDIQGIRGDVRNIWIAVPVAIFIAILLRLLRLI